MPKAVVRAPLIPVYRGFIWTCKAVVTLGTLVTCMISQGYVLRDAPFDICGGGVLLLGTFFLFLQENYFFLAMNFRRAVFSDSLKNGNIRFCGMPSILCTFNIICWFILINILFINSVNKRFSAHIFNNCFSDM